MSAAGSIIAPVAMSVSESATASAALIAPERT